MPSHSNYSPVVSILLESATFTPGGVNKNSEEPWSSVANLGEGYLYLKSSNSALCSYPHVKVPIRDLSQTFTTALIFQQSHYFRQKYLEITTCAVSLLNNIWVRVEHSLLQQLNLKIINCSSGSP